MWDFAIFEKAKEIYDALRKIAWGSVSVVGLVATLAWLLVDYAKARAISLIEWISSGLPQININLANVPIDWSRINQWIPLTEGMTFLAIYFTLVAAVIAIKIVKKLFSSFA